MGKDEGLEMPLNEWGIIPRVVEDVFRSIENGNVSCEYMILLSYIEIYMERINDLLNPKLTNLRIRQSARRGVYVEGATELKTSSKDEMMDIIRRGNEAKAMSSTKMNKVGAPITWYMANSV